MGVFTLDKLADGDDLVDFQNRYRCKDGSYTGGSILVLSTGVTPGR